LFAAVCLSEPASAEPLEAPPAGVRFSGRSWTVVDDPQLRGPGPNVFDGSNVSVDGAGRLVLETALRDGTWTSAHVFLDESLGLGQYELTLAPFEKALDDAAVFGFFTWDEDPAFAHREIDIEIARWGEPLSPNLNFTVQPWEGFPERVAGFEFDFSARTVLRFDWRPEAVRFSAVSGGREATWEFPAPGAAASAPSGAAPFGAAPFFGAPPPGKERVGINLWFFGGRAPSAPDRIVVERFSFVGFDR
jgi:hypothetical protein